MLANQPFHVVSGDPTAVGEISFQVHQADPSMSQAFVLVARCADGGTCNDLAAMFEAVVKSSSPQPVCGSLPQAIGAPKKELDLLAGGAEANVPKEGDTVSLCARLAACTIASKPDTTDDVGIRVKSHPPASRRAARRATPAPR